MVTQRKGKNIMQKCKCGNDIFIEITREETAQSGVKVKDDGSLDYDGAGSCEPTGDGNIEFVQLECERCGEIFRKKGIRKTRIIIEVRGGVVQQVYSNTEVDVDILDYDDLLFKKLEGEEKVWMWRRE